MYKHSKWTEGMKLSAKQQRAYELELFALSLPCNEHMVRSQEQKERLAAMYAVEGHETPFPANLTDLQIELVRIGRLWHQFLREDYPKKVDPKLFYDVSHGDKSPYDQPWSYFEGCLRALMEDAGLPAQNDDWYRTQIVETKIGYPWP
jgi:hypothetical protein